ncbi:MAG TPA: hypothetical protein PKJ41_03735 [Bryobacteraceae bacterium]|nr:hypothetical protein [Bryobacteraceae bacterium]HPT28502.1 hypothetical protein [Bryobacteraceae bacterium]
MQMSGFNGFSDAIVVIAVIANAVTCVALIWTIRAHRIARRGVEVAEQSIEVSQKSVTVAQHGVRNDARALVISWGGEVIDLLAEVRLVFRSSGDGTLTEVSEPESAALASRVSALIDKARMLFPNMGQEWYGVHKRLEDRGIRPPILDLLVLLFDLIEGYCDRRTPVQIVTAGTDEVRTYMLRLLKSATVIGVPEAIDQYEIHLSKLRVTGFPAYLKSFAADGRKFEIDFADCGSPSATPASP